jgi:hypothetical protein
MTRLLLLVVLTLALSGCSALSTGVVPAGESSVVYEAPDTTRVQELPPADVGGEATQPAEITVYADTSTQPTTDVEAVIVDRSNVDTQTVTVRTRSGSTIERVFHLPQVGETLTLFGDSVGLSGNVAGAPTSYKTSVITHTIDDPWWQDLRDRIQLAILLLLALALAGLVLAVW